MGKIDIVNDYILKCDNLITSNDTNEANELITLIVSVYEVEIPNITDRLSTFTYYADSNYINDLKILKAILTNYKSNLEIEDQHRKNGECNKFRANGIFG